MSQALKKESDEIVVERARQRVSSRKRLRWVMLFYGVVFLWMCVHYLMVGIQKMDGLDNAKLLTGLFWGSLLTFIWMVFGTIGAACFAKSFAGFDKSFRTEELLVRYHDRLRELRELPDEQIQGQADTVEPGK